MTGWLGEAIGRAHRGPLADNLVQPRCIATERYFTDTRYDRKRFECRILMQVAHSTHRTSIFSRQSLARVRALCPDCFRILVTRQRRRRRRSIVAAAPVKVALECGSISDQHQASRVISVRHQETPSPAAYCRTVSQSSIMVTERHDVTIERPPVLWGASDRIFTLTTIAQCHRRVFLLYLSPIITVRISSRSCVPKWWCEIIDGAPLSI